MSRMIEVRKEIIELKAKQMHIRFTPVAKREANYITQLRQIRSKLAHLKKELSSF